MSLRDYLEQRERELLTELGSLYSQITPREAELAEIRRAKVAIGMSPANALSGLTGLGGIGSGSAVLGLADPFSGFPGSSPLPPGAALAALMSLPPPLGVPSPYAHLTMKQLVVKVLREHFPDGATTRQMLDFFRDAWGRDIERTNLSPQLTRLLNEQVIGRRDDGAWVLIE